MILRATEFCNLQVDFENPSNLTCVLKNKEQSGMETYCQLLAGFSGNATWVTFQDITDTQLENPISVTMPVCIAPVCAGNVYNFVETIKPFLHHQLIHGHPRGTYVSCTFWGVVPRSFGGMVFTGSWFFFFALTGRVLCNRLGSMHYYYSAKLAVIPALIVTIVSLRIDIIVKADDIQTRGTIVAVLAAVFQIAILLVILYDGFAHIQKGITKNLKAIVWYIVLALLVGAVTCMILDFDYNSDMFKHYFTLEDAGDRNAYIAFNLGAFWLALMAEFLIERRAAIYILFGPIIERYFSR